MKIRHLLLLALVAPLAAQAQTTVFSDNFSTSALNPTVYPTPTATSTGYEVASTKATNNSTIGSGDLKLQLNAATTSGFAEIQALFTTTPVALTATGQYIQLTTTFTPTAGILATPATSNGSSVVAGLFNSGGSAPVSGLNQSGLTTTTGSSFATGGTALWQGYNARIANGAGAGGTPTAGNNVINTRNQQNGGGTASNNQELLFSGAGSGAYANPAGTGLGTQTAGGVSLTQGQQYTMTLRLTYDADAASITINSILYTGVGTTGTVLVNQTGTATGANVIATSFDGLALGFRFADTITPSPIPILDFNSLSVTRGVVPEPSTWAMMLAGAGLLVGFVRMRRAA